MLLPRVVQALILSLVFSFGTQSQDVQQPISSPAQDNQLGGSLKPVLTTVIDSFIEGLLRSWNSPGGISVAVVRQRGDGEWKIETKGYGLAGFDGKMSENSLVCIASNSKETKIVDVVPEWGLADSIASAETTIVDAMSHRTGLPRHDLMYLRTDNTSSNIQRLRDLRPSAAFRSTWQYNNNLYTLLAHLPAVLLTRPLARYVKDNIFVPLNLTSTTYSVDVARNSGRFADGFCRDGVNKTEDIFGTGKVRLAPYSSWWSDGSEDGNCKIRSFYIFLYVSGAGGVIMDAKDAARWLQVLLLDGRNPDTGEQVIPAEVLQKVSSGITVMTSKADYPELSLIVYGGGQARGTYRGHEYIAHDGATNGYHTSIMRFPSAKLGIAVFSNDDMYGWNLQKIIKWRLADEVLGLEPIDRDRRPSNPTPPSPSFASLSGVYDNPGYGPMELCFMTSTDSDEFIGPQHDEHHQQTDHCKKLIKEQPLILPGALKKGVPTLIAHWNKAISTHVRLEHFSGNLFNASTLDSRPTHDPSEPYWTHTETEPIITAEFSSDENGELGFGLTGGFWGAGPGVESPVGESAKERAEVWFTKV
ncbi:hypothetical protein D9758_005451 [Tetrapyrgos nigripes]|uniref:Beta-lactamase-related domain-containing protein n=1 Tax=Tetrapyrgos nigripes TaxID=182062 RepID=A0A8H5GHX9_9AGAR|nr:hypothetical protein D9758_005451 [Tetrapyrgos nigripes]